MLLLQRLQEKKQHMMADISLKYGTEKRKQNEQFKEVLRSDDALRDIEESYAQLVRYMEDNSSIRVLLRINEINEYVSSSIFKVDEVMK